MSGSIFGNNIKVSTFGESHGVALGCTVDGIPAGLSLSKEDIQAFLDRRKPGFNPLSTPRKEDDEVEILSGIFEGKTTGTPIALIVRNTSQESGDYSEIASYYRPGHADFTFDSKYGFRDYRGGGRSSGRETIGRVAAGAIASKILKSLGVSVEAYTARIGPVKADLSKYNRENVLALPTAMPDKEANDLALDYVAEMRAEYDSVGGVMECRITNLPAGIGEPVFDKLDAKLAGAVMSIGAVKAVEIGDGVMVSERLGSENNDAFEIKEGKISKKTNHSGGILGGISDGSVITVRAHVKPTPSIFKEQHTVNKSGEEIDIKIKGRHDPIIVPRAVVVMESMCALTVLDLMICNMSSTMEGMQNFYKS
ncbi:MAG: chorismate synthase [Lachnospiraceae bacterium]|nr:chorismate synthase [Lachnospiraceae bacterium]